jgi:succinoglycan biosynthesis protein ExoM
VNISLCIATYRRPAQLAALLGDVAHQQRPPDEVVIVDNDAGGSAGEVVKRWRSTALPFAVVYQVEPVQNISLTRNRSVELAGGDWIAFIDDDERAPPPWLRRLADMASLHGADGVLGPVNPQLPPGAPNWIRRGRFYRWPRMRTGTAVPLKQLRFGNVLLRAALLRSSPPPFDPAYGLTGGEDGDLLARLAQQGARILWCDEALVNEPVTPARLRLIGLLRRSLRGGQDFARHSLAGRHGPATVWRHTSLILRSALQMPVALALALLCWPAGLHHSAYWLLKASANLGKLSILWGWKLREYEAGAS